MKKFSLFAFGVIVVTIMIGCTGSYKLINSRPRVSQADLSLYKTFTILSYTQEAALSKIDPNSSIGKIYIKLINHCYDVQPVKGMDKAILSEMNYNNIANGIRTQLISRGYTESPTSNLIVDFSLFVSKVWANYHLWQNNRYSNFPIIDQEELLVVNLIDKQRAMSVFSAAVSTDIDPKMPIQESLRKCQKASNVLFSAYPVAPVKNVR